MFSAIFFKSPNTKIEILIYVKLLSPLFNESNSFFFKEKEVILTGEGSNVKLLNCCSAEVFFANEN